MNLTSIITRETPSDPWSANAKIPWDDPGFSTRMLNEHLSQEHDLASRRVELIDRQIAWIHDSVLKARPSRILDLACGPGLYAQRLAALGHTCVGIDFGPASIEYAREQAKTSALSIDYRLDDLRSADFGTDFDLVMFVWAEFNAFSPDDAAGLLRKCRDATAPGGTFLLEAHAADNIKEQGQQPPSWYSAEKGLWSDAPHICLQENRWDEDRHVATSRFYVIDAASGAVSQYASTAQAYSDEEFAAMVADAEFAPPVEHPSLTGNPEDASPHCRVFTMNR